jgi:hypothetical protein
MSLINEALKRAKEVQTPPAASAGPQLRPVEAAQRGHNSPGFMAPVTLCVIGVVAGILLWQWMHQGGHKSSDDSQRLVVAARSPAPVLEPVPIAPAPDPEPVVAQPVAADESVTNPPVIAEAPPKPPPLRLQAIFWNPKRPSAIIGGKTLFVGDQFGGARLVAIDRESATLVGLGQTNVLSLGE